MRWHEESRSRTAPEELACDGDRPEKFTEPVALSSTQPDDIPLPHTAVRLRFDLLALRARCVGQLMGDPQERSTASSRELAQFAKF
jgi:hypothetical protein